MADSLSYESEASVSDSAGEAETMSTEPDTELNENEGVFATFGWFNDLYVLNTGVQSVHQTGHKRCAVCDFCVRAYVIFVCVRMFCCSRSWS